ncbi:hypothetical protein F0223_13385 [Vibrio coralliilyticus]|uniref:hypothetical protein n=2 Tax=Vibrio TaxID=662 RepID=UPI00148E7CDB|nr:hypothetical protein [Vibrio coralliilyticus]NOI19227.1 hypothetical protein [Vibrio coralliilyticus]
MSLMIGLSGCSDSGELSQSEADGGTQGTSSGTDENQDNNSIQDNDENQDAEADEPSNEQGGEGSETSDSEDNSESGDGVETPDAEQGDNESSGSGPEDSDAPTDASKLYYQFTRPQLPPNSAPHVQRQNQELSGRPFQVEIYALNEDLKLQDVTAEVTWNAISEECNGEPCYTIGSEGRLIAGAKGKFSAQAEYNGLLTPVIQFETPRKLETCGVEGNTDKAHRTEKCLHIIVGSSGEADGKWFTEPPRASVMSLMWYSFDDTPYNSGYTRSGIMVDGGSGTNQFSLMRNDGYDERVEDTSTIVGGDYGQYDRYCADLATIKFNGRSNWRRVTEAELIELSKMSIGSTYDWPVTGFYASGNVHIRSQDKGGLHLRHVYMQTGQVTSLLPTTKSLPTCVSELLDTPAQ